MVLDWWEQSTWACRVVTPLQPAVVNHRVNIYFLKGEERLGEERVRREEGWEEKKKKYFFILYSIKRNPAL